MLNPDDPLVPAPSDDMLFLDQPSSGDPLDDLATAAIDYLNFNTIVLSAFDDRAWPVFPADEYILDALARRYDLVDDEEALLRPAAGICAVCIELQQCDFCPAWAQYETHVDGTTVSTCAICVKKHGDGRLGAGHSVYLLHLAEVPYAVRDVANELCRRLDRPSIWGTTDGDTPQWCRVLRDIGFVGPYSDGSLHAWLFGTRVQATPHLSGAFGVTVHRRDDRIITLPGFGLVLPSDLDPLQIREEILHEVEGTVLHPQRGLLASVLKPKVAIATERALATMEAGTYERSIDIDSLSQYGMRLVFGTLHSAEVTAAEVAATQSTDPAVVSMLAVDHPDPEIRAMAVGNRACPESDLMLLASVDQYFQVRKTVLDRCGDHDGLLAALTVNVLTNGPLDTSLALDLLLHPACPATFHEALMDRVYSAGPQFRLGAAFHAHRASADRRDYVHEYLLTRAIRIPHTVALIDELLGIGGLANRERVGWMLDHSDRKIQRLVGEYLDHDGMPTHGTLADGLRAIGLSNRLRPLGSGDGESVGAQQDVLHTEEPTPDDLWDWFAGRE